MGQGASKAVVQGDVAPGYESVKDIFTENFEWEHHSLSLATVIWFLQHGTRGECPAVCLCGGGEGRRSLGQQKLDLLHCRHIDNCLLKVFDSNVITMGLFGQNQLLQGMNLIVTPQHKESYCHCHCITLWRGTYHLWCKVNPSHSSSFHLLLHLWWMNSLLAFVIGYDARFKLLQ